MIRDPAAGRASSRASTELPEEEKMKRVLVTLTTVLVAALLASGGAQGAPAPTAAPAKKIDYPEKGKAISIIVPYSAGGGTDLGARNMAAGLEKELGSPVQVLNRPGAGGQIGVTAVNAAKPDGYTIGFSNWPQIIPLYLDPSRGATFSRESLAPIAIHLSDPIAVGVLASSPYKSLKDVVDAAKAAPEKIISGDDGIQGLANLTLLQLERLSGAKFANVHFDGCNPGVVAMLGGHVHMSQYGSNCFQAAQKSGEVRVIAIVSRSGSKFFPQVTTTEAQGYKIYSDQFRGYFAPKGIPPEIVNTLAAAMKKVMETEEHRQKMDQLGQLIFYKGPEEFSALWKELEVEQKALLEMAAQQK
jgi:tripartite-type tricarboxylate transporter receptor subunit TctC